jgi:hypothetical protein
LRHFRIFGFLGDGGRVLVDEERIEIGEFRFFAILQNL